MKKEKSVFYKSSAAVTALFVLGNAVMVLPDKSADGFTLYGFAVAALTAILLTIILIPIAHMVLSEGKAQNYFILTVKCIFLVALAVYVLFVAADVFSDFTAFVKYLILPEIPKWVITAVFGLVVVYFASKRQEDTLKFSLLCFCFTVIAVVFFFIAISGNFDAEYIVYDRMPNADEALNATSPYLLKTAMPIVILPFYFRMVFEDNCKGACIGGITAGFVLLCICMLSSILLFSPVLAGRLSYPYASAVSTVTVGKLFTRMDGFSYFVYFSAAVTKINVCIFVASDSLKRLNKTMSSR